MVPVTVSDVAVACIIFYCIIGSANTALDIYLKYLKHKKGK